MSIPVLAKLAGVITSALGLKNSSTTVDGSNSSAPTLGQVITATSSTEFTWQDPIAGSVSLAKFEKSVFTENLNVPIGSAEAVRWDVETAKPSDYTHSNTTNPSRVYVNTSGVYVINATVTSENDGGSRISVGTSLFLNGVELPTTFATSYDRGNAYNLRGKANKNSTILSLTSGDYLEVRGWRDDADSSSPTVYTQPNYCELNLAMISSAAATATSEYTHPADGFTFGTALAGATVISALNVNASGHLVSTTNRELTKADLGVGEVVVRRAIASTTFTNTEKVEQTLVLGIPSTWNTYDVECTLTGTATEPEPYYLDTFMFVKIREGSTAAGTSLGQTNFRMGARAKGSQATSEDTDSLPVCLFAFAEDLTDTGSRTWSLTSAASSGNFDVYTLEGISWQVRAIRTS